MKRPPAAPAEGDGCHAVLERELHRQQAARAVIEHLRPLERWRPHGEAVLCGAASYGLLVAPDIDIEVFGDMDVHAGFSVVAGMVAEAGVRRASFINAVGEDDAGHGWDVRYSHQGVQWHVEMWLLPADYAGPRSSHLATVLRGVLDDATRCRILRLKEQAVDRATCHSFDIYRAVLDHGIDDIDEFATWVAANAATRLMHWTPRRDLHLVRRFDAEEA